MIEHLGPSYFDQNDYVFIVQTVCSFCDNDNAALRQAASYGIGVVAEHSGSAFNLVMDTCLQALRAGINLTPTAQATAKKSKLIQFYHS